MGRVSKVALNTNTDPDFGSKVPEVVAAYVVSITSEDRDYHIIAMLPQLDTEEESIHMLDQVLQLFLEEDEEYAARLLQDDDVENWINEGGKNPVLGFNPDSLNLAQIEFFWLVPPRILMH